VRSQLNARLASIKGSTLSRSLSACIRFCSFAGAVIVLMAALQWTIIDVVTPFLFYSLQAMAWLLLLVGFIWAIVVRVRTTVSGSVANYPLLICSVAIVIALFVPWTRLWLVTNERLYRTDRERIVRQVEEGSLRPNVSYNRSLIALGSGAPAVSEGGNEILVEEHNGHSYVFFFTYRGILSHYSGFLFVPTGADPRLFADAADGSTILEQRNANWFFLAHR
jgi:hypothetical protein